MFKHTRHILLIIALGFQLTSCSKDKSDSSPEISMPDTSPDTSTEIQLTVREKFLEAIKTRDLDEVKNILKTSPDEINLKWNDRDGQNYVRIAYLSGYEKLVDFLIGEKFPVDPINPNQYSSSMLKRTHRDQTVASLILKQYQDKKHSDVNLPTWDIRTQAYLSPEVKLQKELRIFEKFLISESDLYAYDPRSDDRSLIDASVLVDIKLAELGYDSNFTELLIRNGYEVKKDEHFIKNKLKSYSYALKSDKYVSEVILKIAKNQDQLISDEWHLEEPRERAGKYENESSLSKIQIKTFKSILSSLLIAGFDFNGVKSYYNPLDIMLFSLAPDVLNEILPSFINILSFYSSDSYGSSIEAESPFTHLARKFPFDRIAGSGACDLDYARSSVAFRFYKRINRDCLDDHLKNISTFLNLKTKGYSRPLKYQEISYLTKFNGKYGTAFYTVVKPRIHLDSIDFESRKKMVEFLIINGANEEDCSDDVFREMCLERLEKFKAEDVDIKRLLELSQYELIYGYEKELNRFWKKYNIQ